MSFSLWLNAVASGILEKEINKGLKRLKRAKAFILCVWISFGHFNIEKYFAQKAHA